MAVKKAWDLSKVSDSIKRARKMVKKLRTPVYLRLLKAEKKKKPILDCKPRWMATYDMVDSLLELREFCREFCRGTETDEDGELIFLSERDWKILEDMHSSLKPAKICTLKLQQEQLTLGDFYGAWLHCKYATKKASNRENDLASLIVSQMQTHEKNLFKSKAFITGIFLDPRYDVMLDAQQRELAVKHIVEVFERLQQLLESSGSVQVDQAASEREAEAEETLSSEDEENPIERMLRLKEKQSARGRQENALNLTGTSAKRSLLESLKTYGTSPRLPRKESLLEYWEQQKQKWPELYQVARALLAVPCTQVLFLLLFRQ